MSPFIRSDQNHHARHSEREKKTRQTEKRSGDIKDWTCLESPSPRGQLRTVLVSKLVLWTQSTTKDYNRAEHKLHTISELFISQVILLQVMFFWAYLYSAGTQHGNLHPTGWAISFWRPRQEPVIAKANTRKNWERFCKKCRWMNWKGRNKQGRNPWQ